MDEQQLLSRLRRGDEQALAAVIARFSAYVVTVIHNRSRGLLSPEDEDELASSTFSRSGSPAGQSRPGASARGLGALRETRPSTGCEGRVWICRWTKSWPEQTIFFSRRLSKGTGAAAAQGGRAAVRGRPRDHPAVLRPVPDRAGNRRRAGADPFRGAYAAGTQPGSHQKRVMPGRVCI